MHVGGIFLAAAPSTRDGHEMAWDYLHKLFLTLGRVVLTQIFLTVSLINPHPLDLAGADGRQAAGVDQVVEMGSRTPKERTSLMPI